MKYVLASNPKAVEGAAGVKLHDILNRGVSIAQHRLWIWWYFYFNQILFMQGSE